MRKILYKNIEKIDVYYGASMFNEYISEHIYAKVKPLRNPKINN